MNKTIADDVLEIADMLVCSVCKEWLRENESEPCRDASGAIARESVRHKFGCPAKPEAYRPKENAVYGDD